MFVGETGVGRVVRRACEIMNEHKTDDVRKFGAIDLPTLQRYLNFHYSVSLDLFGQELSTNAANYYTMGLKGRYRETNIDDDHVLTGDSYPVFGLSGDATAPVDDPALNAVNERLRNDYTADCRRGVHKWNRIIRDAAIDFRLELPNPAFHRTVGAFAAVRASPGGTLLTEAEWERRHHQWLPTNDDTAYVASLMGAVTEPGKFANWIAPPAKGIDGRPTDFEYVRFD